MTLPSEYDRKDQVECSSALTKRDLRNYININNSLLISYDHRLYMQGILSDSLHLEYRTRGQDLFRQPHTCPHQIQAGREDFGEKKGSKRWIGPVGRMRGDHI